MISNSRSTVRQREISNDPVGRAALGDDRFVDAFHEVAAIDAAPTLQDSVEEPQPLNVVVHHTPAEGTFSTSTLVPLSVHPGCPIITMGCRWKYPPASCIGFNGLGVSTWSESPFLN